MCVPGAWMIQLWARGSNGNGTGVDAMRQIRFVINGTLTVLSFGFSMKLEAGYGRRIEDMLSYLQPTPVPEWTCKMADLIGFVCLCDGICIVAN